LDKKAATIYSDDEDSDTIHGYQNAAYWSLPDNVRHAIDLSKHKSKHTDFYNALSNLNEKISLYKIVFYSKKTKHEQAFIEKERRNLIKGMQQD